MPQEPLGTANDGVDGTGLHLETELGWKALLEAVVLNGGIPAIGELVDRLRSVAGSKAGPAARILAGRTGRVY